MLSRYIQSISNRLGFKVSRIHGNYGRQFERIYKSTKDYSMTSRERAFSLYNAVLYLSASGIKGDLVECGVWKGGSAMVIAYTLKELGQTDRKIYLYDTYEGMAKPTDKDRLVRNNKLASELWREGSGHASLDEVKKNLLLTGYPEENIVFIKGKVEETIPNFVPKSIALLRLDTDWYDSTYHEFKYLFPLLEQRGVLIVDDYGYWTGSKEATDKYLAENNIKIMLNYIDPESVIGVKF